MSGSQSDTLLRWVEEFTGLHLKNAANGAGAAAPPGAIAAPGNGAMADDTSTDDGSEQSVKGDVCVAPDPAADPNTTAGTDDGSGQSGEGDVCVAPDPAADPNPAAGSGPAEPPPPPDDGAAADSPLHAAWKAGYDEGYTKPNEEHPAPSPYNVESANAYDAGVIAGKAAVQTPRQPPAEPPSNNGGTPLSPTDATPNEDQPSTRIGGFPAFRFNLPLVPIAQAQIVTPAMVVSIALSLRGSVTVTFPNPPPGVSADINDEGLQGWRLEAGKAVGRMSSSIRVNGLGTDRLSIGSVAGTQFANTETRFQPPSTVMYIGQAKYDYKVPTHKLGDVEVKGQAGFELRVTAVMILPPPKPEPAEEEEGESIFDHVMDGLAFAAKGVIVVVAVAGALESDGTSLLLLKTL